MMQIAQVNGKEQRLLFSKFSMLPNTQALTKRVSRRLKSVGDCTKLLARERNARLL